MVSRENLERLLTLVKEKALLPGEFVFVSGVKSSYYIDGRVITLSAEGVPLVGRMVFDTIVDVGVDAVGGPTLGADPIVTAVVFTSYQMGKPIHGFIVRGELKTHGTQKQIEGNIKEGWRVAIVDDVITTGGSILRAIKAVEEKGCRVVKVVTLLDWQQGGSNELRRRGYEFTSFLSADASGKVYINE